MNVGGAGFWGMRRWPTRILIAEREGREHETLDLGLVGACVHKQDARRCFACEDERALDRGAA